MKASGASRSSPEDFVHHDSDLGQEQRSQRVGSRDRNDLGVPVRSRPPADADGVAGQIDQPGLRDSGSGVAWDLHVAVALEGRVGSGERPCAQYGLGEMRGSIWEGAALYWHHWGAKKRASSPSAHVILSAAGAKDLLSRRCEGPAFPPMRRTRLS